MTEDGGQKTEETTFSEQFLGVRNGLAAAVFDLLEMGLIFFFCSPMTNDK
jgi:hypothetical protein